MNKVILAPILIIPLILLTGPSVVAQPCIVDCLVQIGPAQCTNLGGLPVVLVTYENTAMSGFTALAFAVAQNSLGQTVYYTTSTLVYTAGGENLTARLILIGLPHGTYDLAFFAMALNGVAVSFSSTVNCTL